MKIILLNILVVFLLLSCKSSTDKNPEDDPAIKDTYNASVKEVKGFYFVGIHSRIPSIYYYDFTLDRVTLVKSNKEEKIYELELAPDGNAFFYLTYKELNRKIAIPEINGIKIFRYEPAVEKSELLSKLKPAIQLYSYWMDNDRYRVVAISFDEVVASYINKNAITFNYFGKLLSDENELFDLVKSGYPVIETPAMIAVSPRKRFEVVSKNDTLFVRNNYDNSDKKLNITKDKLVRISWADDLKHLIIMIKNNPLNKTDTGHKILIYDLINKKIVKTFEEASIKSFILLGDFLMFDHKSVQDFEIKIIRLSNLEQIKTLNIKGGCALKSLPIR